MKKLSEKQKKHFFPLERKKRWKQLCAARIKKHKERLQKQLTVKDRVINADYYKTLEQRKQLREFLYKKTKYEEPPLTVGISDEFGIENENGIIYFLDKAASFIDFKSSELIFDLKNCTRVWPSAIILLCSLKQWVELTSNPGKTPKLASSNSDSSKVNSYLAHCGFYDYVGRPKDTIDSSYSDKEVVKIQRETKTKNIEQREEDIIKLLEEYSDLCKEDLELFNCVILTEIFNNVTEHGISHIDRGWWLLAQRHEQHKIISLCIADNGIGIRHSLMTGPQRDEIGKKVQNTTLNDGEFIKLALEENVSGSIYASIKTEGIIRKKYESGARRGNGLKRIEKACKNLKIPLSIISHYGYVFLDEYGKMINYGARKTRVFSGTMYHLVIKCK